MIAANRFGRSREWGSILVPRRSITTRLRWPSAQRRDASTPCSRCPLRSKLSVEQEAAIRAFAGTKSQRASPPTSASATRRSGRCRARRARSASHDQPGARDTDQPVPVGRPTWAQTAKRLPRVGAAASAEIGGSERRFRVTSSVTGLAGTALIQSAPPLKQVRLQQSLLPSHRWPPCRQQNRASGGPPQVRFRQHGRPWGRQDARNSRQRCPWCRLCLVASTGSTPISPRLTPPRAPSIPRRERQPLSHRASATTRLPSTDGLPTRFSPRSESRAPNTGPIVPVASGPGILRTMQLGCADPRPSLPMAIAVNGHEPRFSSGSPRRSSSSALEIEPFPQDPLPKRTDQDRHSRRE